MPEQASRKTRRRRDNRASRYALVLCSAVLSTVVGGCAFLRPLPEPRSLPQRLEAFPTRDLPIRQPVEIRWNAHQVPFILAENDDDAAFALGLVHAHLRLGQLAIYKRIVAGRIAELGGPLATDIDAGLRILNFARAADEIEANLPAETRRWLQGFVDGLNYYQSNVRPLPYEFQALGMEPELWRIRDLLAFGRLGGTDVNWLVWANLLPLRDRADWPQIWNRLVAQGAANMTSFDQADARSMILEGIAGTGKTGSNSIAVAASRTTTGSALIANDPHLGINVPNTWLIVGLQSPSMHLVGLMPVGLPLFAIGRNPWIAWGGTNMRAAASDLVDVSTLSPSEIVTREEDIKVRWWPDRTVAVRESAWGPIISDAPLLKDLDLPDVALRWTGHDVSDEISAMLAVARSKNFGDFRRAFETFSVPGQNMLYADREGNIGQVMAVRIPDREGPPPDGIITDMDAARRIWDRLRNVGDLPFSYNPPAGYLASANNKPVNGTATVGYFFSPDDRMRRMAAIMGAEDRIDLQTLKALQEDVYVHSSVILRDTILGKMTEMGVRPQTDTETAAMRTLEQWDGFYRAEAHGPVIFEIFRHELTIRFYAALMGEEDAAALSRTGGLKTLLAEDLARSQDPGVATMLRESLDKASTQSVRFESWGEMHRLEMRHPLAFLPVIGRRFVFANHPIGGSTESLMKTAHASSAGRHTTRYGANARHISDLSDMDNNLFVLLGGQDGWLNSSTFLDQEPLWLQGDYISVPLRLESVKKAFSISMNLMPDDT